VWTPKNEAYFHALKAALVSTPVFALSDLKKRFVIETDSYGIVALGWFLYKMGTRWPC
jgi:hypothetical protein